VEDQSGVPVVKLKDSGISEETPEDHKASSLSCVRLQSRTNNVLYPVEEFGASGESDTALSIGGIVTECERIIDGLSFPSDTAGIEDIRHQLLLSQCPPNLILLVVKGLAVRESIIQQLSSNFRVVAKRCEMLMDAVSIQQPSGLQLQQPTDTTTDSELNCLSETSVGRSWSGHSMISQRDPEAPESEDVPQRRVMRRSSSSSTSTVDVSPLTVKSLMKKLESEVKSFEEALSQPQGQLIARRHERIQDTVQSLLGALGSCKDTTGTDKSAVASQEEELRSQLYELNSHLRSLLLDDETKFKNESTKTGDCVGKCVENLDVDQTVLSQKSDVKPVRLTTEVTAASSSSQHNAVPCNSQYKSIHATVCATQSPISVVEFPQSVSMQFPPAPLVQFPPAPSIRFPSSFSPSPRAASAAPTRNAHRAPLKRFRSPPRSQKPPCATSTTKNSHVTLLHSSSSSSQRKFHALHNMVQPSTPTQLPMFRGLRNGEFHRFFYGKNMFQKSSLN